MKAIAGALVVLAGTILVGAATVADALVRSAGRSRSAIVRALRSCSLR